ncbi:MAG: transporter substrate-binding domain-containing protein [Elusimicrobiota bacterium]|nr:transporter substrate-binding domain-containing protein [Elusimicrobiota bacterium]
MLGVKQDILLVALGLGLSGFFAPVIKAEATGKITLWVGAYENNPKIYKDNDGKAAGFYKDTLDYIAQKEGWEIKYVWATWEECLDKLGKNQLDIMPDVAISAERQKKYAFNSESFLTNWARVYAASGQEADNFLDLKNKKIAVMAGSIHTDGITGIKNLIRGFDISCEFIEAVDYRSVFELLDRGKADFGIVNRTFGNANAKKYKVHRTQIIFNPSDLRFAFPPEAALTPRLIERIDFHLKQLKAKAGSPYYVSLEKHFGISVEKVPLPKWLSYLLYAGLPLILILAGAVIITRKQIRDKTKELDESQGEVIDRLGKAIEYRDNYTGRHISIVSEICYLIGRDLGLSQKECDILKKAATMHDIGKMAIEDAILLKPGSLSGDEWEKMKKHSSLGADMLSQGNSQILKTAESIALYHHERWDGSGYPRKIKGKSIPLAARICTVADVFDALISKRPYKEAWTLQKSIDEILLRKGSHFDPKIVEAFLEILPQITRQFSLDKSEQSAE